MDDKTVESDDWWVFVYNTAAYVRTRDFRQSLIDNPPIMVNKATGEAEFGRTDISIEEQLYGRSPDQPPSIWQDPSDVFGEDVPGDTDEIFGAEPSGDVDGRGVAEEQD